MSADPELAARRTRRGAETRDSILAAAEASFADDGFSSSRLIDISQRAGVTTGALYRYFEGKDGLLAELFGDYDVALRQVLESSTDVAAATAGWIELGRRRAGTLRAVEEALKPDTELNHAVRDARQHWVAILATVLRGSGTARQQQIVADLLVGALEQYLLVERMGWGEQRPAADVAALLGALVSRGTAA